MSKHDVKNMLMPLIERKKYTATVYLERPGRANMIVREYHFSIPLSELENFRSRDVYVYAKIKEED